MTRIFYPLLFLIVLFSISHFLFEPAYLYHEIPWLDIPMHILGGMGVGALTYALLTHKKKHVSFMRMLAVYVAIAIAWEMYEYLRGVMVYDSLSEYMDTVYDLLNGVIGISFAYFLLKKK